jgi:hypothetical protein
MPPDEFEEGKSYVFDTQTLFAALCGQPKLVNGLERTARILEVENVRYLHNAGNDAHVGDHL